jgi:mannose-6-phosphate isomerase
MQWYPLKFTAHVRSYAFGARRIPETLGKSGMPDGIVAETWEISDYKDTTGSVIIGALQGKSLRELVQQFPQELVGKGWNGPHFPLLEKFLDATHMLPVHLHADDEKAKCIYCEPNGKTEAWHILHAEPGASILIGLQPNQNRQSLYDAFKRQDYDAVIRRHPIKAGDTVYVPAGVFHSFGPGTLVFEVQQTSDLHQSVMPTDVYGKKLDPEQWEKNINAALDEVRPEFNPAPHAGLVRKNGDNKYVIGCAGPYFALERWTLEKTHKEPAHDHRCMTLTNIGDDVSIEYGGAQEVLHRGESCIIPASMGEFSLVPQAVGEVIACFVPDLDEDVRKPLRDYGHTKDAVAAIGEV